MAVSGPGTACSVTLTLTLPLDPVTVTDFATVGSVYVVLACPFEPVIAGLGENVPPKPASLNAMEAPTTTFPNESLAFTTMGNGNLVPTVPVCFPPETTDSVATSWAAVSVKVADV